MEKREFVHSTSRGSECDERSQGRSVEPQRKAVREWQAIEDAAQHDENLAELLKARELCFSAGLDVATDALGLEARRYYRQFKREIGARF